ncbi:hypothetical protein DND47_30515, partial [Pseudomonas syringae pv. syringae]
MIFLYNVIGISAFAGRVLYDSSFFILTFGYLGLAFMLALIPLNLVLARIMRRLSQSLMKRKDDRVYS